MEDKQDTYPVIQRFRRLPNTQARLAALEAFGKALVANGDVDPSVALMVQLISVVGDEYEAERGVSEETDVPR